MTRMPTEKSITHARDAALSPRSRRAAAPLHRYREASLVLNRRRDVATDRFGHLKRVYD
jgi:hypothetical protein